MSYKNQYQQLWNRLNSDTEANIQFANLVIEQEPINTAFFFGDYSLPILKWIVISVFSSNKVEKIIPTIIGDYYEFVSNPIDDFNTPQWYQLKSYRGDNNLKLKSWIMSNSYQYFTRKNIKANNQAKKEGELLDFVDYEALLKLGDNKPELSDEEQSCHERLSKAWKLLSEKDKNVIHCLIIEKLHWIDAFDELNEYINPRGGREVMNTWTDKRKQDALAMMKARAIEHLVVKFNQVKS